MGGKEQRRGGREKGNYSSKERKKEFKFYFTVSLVMQKVQKIRKDQK